MRRRNNPSADAAKLRRKAEERQRSTQRSQGSEKRTQRAAADARELVQELQIHQIELEIQNEELRKSRVAVEALLDEYIDLYDFAPVGYFTLERDGTIRRMNLYGARLLGEERARRMNRRFGQFVAEADLPVFNAFLLKAFTNRATASDKAACEVTLCNKKDHPPAPELSGSRFFGEANQRQVHIEATVTEDGQECRAVVLDITDLKRAEEALRESKNRYRELSIHDGLTQLYNSRHFYHQLKFEMARADRYGQALTLLILDIDDFKIFNDAYGHVEGDQVLLRLGQVIKRCLRQTDSAYRYGGEEFTIILPAATSANATVIAERIGKEFKKENFPSVSGQEVHITVSIGLAQYKPREDIKAFVHRVDQLMYQAKKNGKDRVCAEA